MKKSFYDQASIYSFAISIRVQCRKQTDNGGKVA